MIRASTTRTGRGRHDWSAACWEVELSDLEKTSVTGSLRAGGPSPGLKKGAVPPGKGAVHIRGAGFHKKNRCRSGLSGRINRDAKSVHLLPIHDLTSPYTKKAQRRNSQTLSGELPGGPRLIDSPRSIYSFDNKNERTL